jgi:hypothetical protein
MSNAADTGADAPRSNPSDLARRITHRRVELGISVEELAKRAGVDPVYLSYFERSPDARLSSGTLLLIALALDTTLVALSGGLTDRPRGHGQAGRHPVLEVLDDGQCMAHLAAGGVGRLIYSSDRGPVAVPVNFEYSEDQVIISTDAAKAAALEALGTVGFEIDRIDEAMSEGWSVLVTGPVRRVDDPDEIRQLSSLDLEAWAGGDRHQLIALRPDALSGRVIVHESPPEED